MKFERPNSNIVPFGTNANENKRFAFGTNNYTNDINENLNDSFKLGWETVGINSKPPRQWFNGLAYTSTYLTSYLFQTGIPEWNDKQKYYINSIVMGSDGNIYRSLDGTEETPNTNNNPTLAGSVSWKSILSDCVKLSGNQTIAGVKTFSSSPIVPTPTTGTQAVNKSYVDLSFAASSTAHLTTFDISKQGLYSVEGIGLGDAPESGALYWGVAVMGNEGTVRSMIATSRTTGNTYVRGWDGSSWTSWKRLDGREYIGSFITAYTIFDNCIVAFGGEFNRADYPKLWAYLQANPTLVKTQTQWQTEATANGGICGYFSSGNGTTTFRVPNLDKAFLRPDNRGVGSYQGDTIRNITGGIGNFPAQSTDFNRSPEGAFTETSGVSLRADIMSQTTLSKARIEFNASLVVPTSTENRPKNIAVLPLIVAK